MNYSTILYGLFISLLLTSCANYKLNYAKTATDWQQQSPPTDLDIRHSIYLIGDTGNASADGTLPTFQYLQTALADAPENSSIIFLGDNIYPVGMPSQKETAERQLAEHKLDVQLEMLRDYKGQIFFIPGNHDWERYGVAGIKRQEKYIEKQLNQQRGVTNKKDDNWQNYFYPSSGCGDPKVLKINDQLTIILIDSQWWLEDWDKHPEINADCEVKNRDFFKFQLEEIFRKHRDKNVVVAMHHPLYSNGQHGGYFTAADHLFPLRALNKKLYVPLPVLGTGLALYRATVGVQQDLAHHRYKALREDILTSATKYGNFIFAAGHEHNLQYIERDRQHFIVSGAGSKKNPVRIGEGSEFAYGNLGYSKLDFYEDGSTWVQFFVVNEAGTAARLVFRKKIKDKLPLYQNGDIGQLYDQKDSIKVRRPSNYNLQPSVGKFHKWALGNHYRDLYLKDYPFEVLDLSTFQGGVKPIKRGGGNQTNSLRLEDAQGKEWVMRSLTKDPSRTLPHPLNQVSGAKTLLQDNFLSAYPFAALVVADLAEASGVYHANPKLYYIPKQPALGAYGNLFGDDIYLVEERLAGNWQHVESLGNSKKLISTLDVMEKMTKNHKHRIEQNYVVRARLFDMLIKDWDRHDDQWRWAKYEDEEGKYYRPIPRDRDQAFAEYDGWAIKLFGYLNPFYRQLQPYSPDMKNIRWASWNAKHFDTNFIGEMERSDWLAEARWIQENVTYEVIEASFLQVPVEARNEQWQQMIYYTKQRRDNLLEFAEMAYAYNAQQVDILGTNKRDLFLVERLGNAAVSVQVFALDQLGNKEKLRYERVFNHGETKEIHLYGLEGDDIFRITGVVEKSILIRIIGGLGEDEMIDQSVVQKGRKQTLIYDAAMEKNDLQLGNEGVDKTSTDVELNTYNRKHNHYHTNYLMHYPVPSINQDDGLVLGFNFQYFQHQFKKNPYGQRHGLQVEYATIPRSIDLIYQGEFLAAIGSWDVVSKLRFSGDRYSFNYFGMGNESINSNPDDLAFNRVRQSKRLIQLGLRQRFAGDNGSFSITPLLEKTEIEPTANRFVVSDAMDLGNTVFAPTWYAGVETTFRFEGLDQAYDPHHGLRLLLQYNLESNLDRDVTFGKLTTALTLYRPVDRQERLIWATKVGYESIQGEYDFFKAPTIGGATSLRGFRAERFRADQVFYHTNELRYQLLTSINSIFPFSLGLHSSFDYGRVWLDGESSNQWHHSFGGGFWIAPLDAIVLSTGIYFSEEDERVTVTVGHQF